MLASSLFTISAALQPKVLTREPPAEACTKNSTLLPYLAAGIVFALLFAVERREPVYPDLSMTGIAVLVSVLVATGQLLGRRAILAEEGRNEALRGELRYQAFHDSLTGLANRALFCDRLSHALERRRADSTCHAVLMIDLDRFKSINDALGHEAGDRLLRVVSDRLSSTVRSGDTVARLGGDEFVVLLEDVSSSQCPVELAERIVQAVRQPFSIDGRVVRPELSIGIATTSSEPRDAEQLLHFADIAVCDAKQDPATSYSIFETGMELVIADRIELERDLRTAVEDRQLRVFYQPIVELQSNRVTGFEALVRWEHPERGLTSTCHRSSCVNPISWSRCPVHLRAQGCTRNS
jgi:diguanylate cyclase (GGDEF)-like protein